MCPHDSEYLDPVPAKDSLCSFCSSIIFNVVTLQQPLISHAVPSLGLFYCLPFLSVHKGTLVNREHFLAVISYRQEMSIYVSYMYFICINIIIYIYILYIFFYMKYKYIYILKIYIYVKHSAY